MTDKNLLDWMLYGGIEESVDKDSVEAALAETIKYREEDARVEQRISRSSNRIPSGKKGRSMDVKL